jgi:hypothetical protein
MVRPKMLWKFRTVDDRLRGILERQELWFAAPATFNDPYDCAPVIDSSATLQQVRTHFIRSIWKENPDIPRAERVRFVNELASAHPFLRPGFSGSDAGDDYLRRTLDGVISRTGVLSLGSDPTVVLMWSHYAASHTGVALAFNTNSAILQGAERVQYEQDRPVIRFFKEQNTMIAKALFTKADYWAYENEWRVLSRNSVGYQLFDPRDLPTIVFGAKCSLVDMRSVEKWARIGGLAPAFYQAQFDSKTFKLRLKGVAPPFS